MKDKQHLEWAFVMLTIINEAMKYHGSQSECPFCMGELFDNKERARIAKIQEHLGLSDEQVDRMLNVY